MRKVKFGDVVREVKLKVDRNNNPYEFYVAGDHMDTEDLKIRRRGKFATDDVGPAFIRKFHAGQILYGSRRTYLKKVAVADFDGITANTTFVLETKDEAVLIQRLVPFIMLSEGFTKWSITKSKGSTNPYVLFSDIAEYEFNLPSLEEQINISKILWSVNDTIEAYKKLTALTDELVKARFVEMFENKNYPIQNIGEISDVITKGTTPTTLGFDYVNEGVNFIKVENITTTGQILSSDLMHITQDCHEKLMRSQLQEGDILFSIAGAMGRTTIISEEVLPANINQALAIIRLKKNANVLKTYVLAALGSNYVKKQYDNQKKGIAQINLNLKNISDLLFPIPPYEQQEQFADFVRQSDKSKLELDQAITAAKAMMKRIIAEKLG